MKWKAASGKIITMNSHTLTVEIIPDEEQGFTARVPDIPAYGEGKTEAQAIADLKDALIGYIETFGVEDAVSHLTKPALRELDWDLAKLVRA